MRPGEALGHYRILEEVGAGAMGVVFRARDERLHRDVAIKTLPSDLGRDAARLQRMRHEARFLAELNHPGIAAIHGLEEQAGELALVLEFVDGPTLDEILGRGRLPLAAAVPLARQLAEALEYAHDRGVLHRDLKPANIKVSSQGRLKILDFGLAKHNLTHPTLPDDQRTTQTLDPTRPGMIVGTVAYMSPEQARGESIDRRSDAWAFGCILFEMLAGRHAFAGRTTSDTIANVLMKEPEWAALPRDLPLSLRRLLRRCLQKDPSKRLRNVGDALLDLTDRGDENEAAPAGRLRSRIVLPWAALALAAAIACGLLIGRRLERTHVPEPTRPVRFLIEPTAGMWLPTSSGSCVAMSPDGTYLVLAGQVGGARQLYRRDLDRVELTPILGTAGATSPFFSPDGEWIGFAADGHLKKVSVRGGHVVTLCDAEQVFGACWTKQDSIVFAPTGTSALEIVPAAGGTSRKITQLENNQFSTGHRLPCAIDDGEHIVFVIDSLWSYTAPRIVMLSRRSGQRRVVVEDGTNPVALSGSQLLFSRGNALMAVPIDPATLSTLGDPIRVEEAMPEHLIAAACLATTGALVLLSTRTPELTETARHDQLVWVDRVGGIERLGMPPGNYCLPSISPDGRWLAITIFEPKGYDLWLRDIQRGTMSRLSDRGNNHVAVWAPDSKRVAFSSDRDGAPNLYVQPIDRSEPARRLTTSQNHQDPCSWSPDGHSLIFWDNRPETGQDLMVLAPDDPGEVRPLVATRFNEAHATFSPDGGCVAYTSDETGVPQVYVQYFPGPGGRTQASVTGGLEPRWNTTGRELYFRSIPDTSLMVVDLDRRNGLQVSPPRALISGEYRRHGAGVPNYAVAAEGSRFLMIQFEKQPVSQVVEAIVNWQVPAVVTSGRSPRGR